MNAILLPINYLLVFLLSAAEGHVMCHAIVIDFHRFVLPTRRTMGGFAQFMGGSPQVDGTRPGHQVGLGATGARLWMDWLWMDECSSIFSKRRPEVLGMLVVFSILASSGDCQSV